MLIVSQNLTNFNFQLPPDCVFRINLAWVNTLSELELLLEKHTSHKIFLDMPIGRTKPPSNSYTMEELIPILTKYDNVSFFAVSNVNSEHDILRIQEILPQGIILVPKIESPEGIMNIQNIVSVIRSKEKIIMLDHDDLYSSLTKQNKPPSEFKAYFNKLVDFCTKNQITLLRTMGVVFSDEEKKVSQYIK